ncbi:LysR family transcriptional regulator [Xanthomonas euvesicatoria pv. allii]|nr:LysR family transcriptional regulator [Xanthomonas euvesicatoria pv. allii]
MATFLAVVETGGFASAARRLSMSPSVVTRAVCELEERLRIKLLTRTTRTVKVTEAGMRYAESCRRILMDIEEADSAAADANALPRGQLTVTSSVNFGCMYISPIARDYLTRFPEVEINCWFLDRIVNLVDEGVDVAIRIGELPDSSLQAIKVGEVREVLCASPTYLRQRGTPKHPEDLSQHVVISATGVTPTPEWRFRDGSKNLAIRVQPRFTTTMNEAAAECAVAGFGITRLPLFQIARWVKKGTLALVLEAFERPAVPIHIVHREGRYGTRKVRAFIDMAVDALRNDIALK